MSPKPAELLPAELLPEFWNEIPSDCMISVTCLLPNGIIVQMSVNQNATLAEVKEVSVEITTNTYIINIICFKHLNNTV